jgi:transcriptional regulator with XRE-family HTH domain
MVNAAPRKTRSVYSGTKKALPSANGDGGHLLTVDETARLHLSSTIRRLRQRNGWSLQRLARESGVSPAAVFKIEKNRMVPSVTVLLKIARAFRKSIGDLLTPHELSEAAIFTSKNRPEVRFAEFPVSLLRISGKLPDRQLEAGIYVIEPGIASSRDGITHAGEEVYFVLSGQVRFEVDGETHLLSEGGSVHLKGHIPHRWENPSDSVARLLFVLTPAPFRSDEEAGPA